MNDLSGLTFDLAPRQTLEGASKANDTLVIAVSVLKLQDIRNLEDDEGRPWRPSKPIVIEMQTGEVRWIPSGMHRITNLLAVPAKFVTVEW